MRVKQGGEFGRQLEEFEETFRRQKELLQTKRQTLEDLISHSSDTEAIGELKTHLAFLYVTEGHYLDAENLLKDVLSVSPDDLTARHLFCQVLITQNRQEDAIDSARSLYKDSPTFSHLNLLIRALWNSKKKNYIEEAYCLAKRAVDIRPGHVESWYRLSRICMKLHRKCEAKWAAEQGLGAQGEETIDIFVQSRDALYRAFSAYRLKRRLEARYWAQLAWELILDFEIPVPYGWYLRLGDILSHLGFKEEAECCLHQACVVNFRETAPRLAAHYVRRGQIRKAWGTMRSLIRANIEAAKHLEAV